MWSCPSFFLNPLATAKEEDIIKLFPLAILNLEIKKGNRKNKYLKYDLRDFKDDSLIGMFLFWNTLDWSAFDILFKSGRIGWN